MKKLLLIMGVFGLWGNLFAQGNSEKQLKINESTYDFYQIKEEKGIVRHDILLTNLGEKDVKILECTSKYAQLSFSWNKSTLKKHDIARLNVALNPKNMRYSFDFPAQLKVLENKDTVVYKLRLKGYVYPAPTTKEEEFSMQEGNLKYINNCTTLHRLTPNSVVTDTFRVYNVWDSVMTLQKGNAPACIKILYVTPKLQPKEEGIVVFSYDASVKHEWGNVYERFNISTNDPEPPSHKGTKSFYILGEIFDDFDSWTPEQLKNAPHVLVDQEEYNFGECAKGSEIKHDFTLTNIGKSDLVFHFIKTSCGCTTGKLEKDTLAPGESTKIKAIFNTGGKRGGQAKDIYLIVNDPEQPKITLRIVGTVKEN